MRCPALLSLLGLAAAGTARFPHEPDHQQRPLVSTGSLPASTLEIPALGFGTWNLKSKDHNASAAVQHAIEVGYRHIDCAAIYGNEPDVGRGIQRGLRAAGITRDEIWITSKLWNNRHGADQVENALDKTLADLRLDYLDLYLMHWPVQDKDGEKDIEFVETWKAMEQLLNTGKVRNIGISNFAPVQLRQLLSHTRVKPYAHQMELHPYLPQSAWLQYHREVGIRVTAYSPLGNMNPTYGKGKKDVPPPLVQHPTMLAVADRRGCTPAQVALTWGITHGASVIPKSQHADRIEENSRLCRLEYEDIRAVQRIGMANLTRFNNPSESWGLKLYDGLQDA